MEFKLNDEQLEGYNSACKLFAESYGHNKTIEDLGEFIGKIEGIMKGMPGDSDSDINKHYIHLGIMYNTLKLEHAERTIEENRKILDEKKFPSEIVQSAIITITLPEAEKQRITSKEMLRYFKDLSV
ncbi:MAG: hypothetical protein NTY20_04820 [Candidatus Aenigmarchaeota archaeon]|nr:hypothetical protein [Candidatus Aenigmarchaeota archaeon]